MRIRSLGYVRIESTDPQQWLEFGTEVLGMMQSPNMPQDGDAVYLKMDNRPFRFAIHKGEKNRLSVSGWELVDKADFEGAKKELEAAGVSYESGSAEGAKERKVQEFISLQDPSGNNLELYWGASLDYAKFVSPQGLDGFQTGFNGDMGLGHVVLPCPNREEAFDFYHNLLGVGETDYMSFPLSPNPEDPETGMHFMHVDNPRHHSLALFGAEMGDTGCIHIMVEVNNVDEVGYCLDRVKQKEIMITSSMGRHTNDRMLSFYMMTPAGFALEFGCDGLQMDWDDYTPTVSDLPSIWGHQFVG